VQDAGGAELGLSLYQLSTFYYSNNMLQDAGGALSRATATLRGHYPEGHDLLVLCKHRLGMIAAAGRDARSAAQLLGDTKSHYAAADAGHPLAAEAAFGLRLAEQGAPDGRLPEGERAAATAAAIADMKSNLEVMAKALGPDHMLVTGGARHLAQRAALAAGRR